jgi:hypothetical protein
MLKQSKNNYHIYIIMEFLKKEMNTVKTKISSILNPNDIYQLPYTNNDLCLHSDTTLHSIKIEK